MTRTLSYQQKKKTDSRQSDVRKCLNHTITYHDMSPSIATTEHGKTDVRASLEKGRVGLDGHDHRCACLRTIEYHFRLSDDVFVPVRCDVGRIEFHVDVVVLGERHERLGERGDELGIVVGRRAWTRMSQTVGSRRGCSLPVEVVYDTLTTVWWDGKDTQRQFHEIRGNAWESGRLTFQERPANTWSKW